MAFVKAKTVNKEVERKPPDTRGVDETIQHLDWQLQIWPNSKPVLVAAVKEWLKKYGKNDK